MNDLIGRSGTLYPQFFRLPTVTAYKRDSTTYFDRHQYAGLQRRIQRQLVGKQTVVRRALRLAYVRFFPALRESAKARSIQWRRQSMEAVMHRCGRVLEHIQAALAYAYWPILVDNAARRLLAPTLKRVFRTQWEQAYLAATRPLKQTSAQKFKQRLLTLAVRHARQRLSVAQLRRLARKLATDYGHLRTFLFLVNPTTPEEFVNEISRLARGNPKQRLTQLKAEHKEITKRRREILGKLPQRAVKVLRLVSDLVYLREERVGWWSKITTDASPLFYAAAKRLNLSYEEFIQLTYDEFMSRSFDRRVLQRRARGYTYVAINGHVRIIFPRRKVANRKSTVKKLWGVPASPGKVRGVVQTANAYTFQNLRSGVILVTQMTTPHATPYVKRVRAIVTDEGGATAHAAIVSRELKIPCIVGTKIATKVFKDGDLVEVNATKGVVRKI